MHANSIRPLPGRFASLRPQTGLPDLGVPAYEHGMGNGAHWEQTGGADAPAGTDPEDYIREYAPAGSVPDRPLKWQAWATQALAVYGLWHIVRPFLR